ncbi:MAG: pyrroline-5-carboxylate reductase [Flavobacteriaceae bacterium]|nr:pyrroline-5-carboxylate reductase [Flavobacteriaceae bacterium]
MNDLGKVAIIGCGNLGKSILNGLLEGETFTAEQLIATKRNLASLQEYEERGVTITSDNARAIADSQLVVLALKPHQMLPFLKEFETAFTKDHIVVSLATGITLAQLESGLKEPGTVFRAMPNTATTILESITCVCGNNNHEGHKKLVTTLFDELGETVFINEDLMESATVLGACGIAYVLRFMRAMVQGGIQIGFSANVAGKIVNQTVKGAAELLIQNGEHPEFEIDKVTTPRGCTIAGLNEMEHNGFSSALIKGIVASYEKIEK